MEMRPSALMDLPIEMWEVIFSKLSTNDALTLRLTSKRFDFLVTNLYDGWTVRFDDRWGQEDKCDHFQGLLQLRIKEVKVVSLLNPLPCPPKHPDFIQKLSMDRRNVEDDQGDLTQGIISPENLQILLQSQNLRDVSLQLTFSTLQSVHYSSSPPLIGYDFRHLRNLQLGLYPSNQESGLELQEFNLINRILSRSIIPNLQSLKLLSLLKYSPAIKFVLAVEIQHFLSKFGQNMRELEIVFFPDDLEASNSPFVANHPLFKQCSGLQTLKLFLEACSNGWRNLLLNQRELVHLDISFPISSRLCGVVTANCYRSLTTIDLFCVDEVDDRVLVDFEEVGRFSLGIFEKCERLRKLKMRKKLNTSRAPDLPEFIIRDVTKLPKSLEHLDLSGFLMRTEDLLQFATGLRDGKNLAILHIAHVGFTGDYGVNGTVLESILQLSSLQSLQVRWGSINREDMEEWDKLNRIFLAYGHSYEFPVDSPLYERFDLRRDPNTLNFIY